MQLLEDNFTVHNIFDTDLLALDTLSDISPFLFSQVVKNGNILHNSPEFVFFPCSTLLSTNFKLLIIIKMAKTNGMLRFKSSISIIILLINVKMPTFDGILT